MNKLFHIFFILCWSNSMFGQSNRIIIGGEVKGINIGEIYIINSVSDIYYDRRNTNIDSGKISRGKFKIYKNYYEKSPTAFRFIIKSKGEDKITGMFIVKSKNSYVKIDTINTYTSPFVYGNTINEELRRDYTKFYEKVINTGTLLDSYADSLYTKYGNKLSEGLIKTISIKTQELISTGDSLLYRYIISHPDSYVSMWKLIERFNNTDYKEIYLKVYEMLSQRLKSSKPLVTFHNQLKKSSTLAINSSFPLLKLKNYNLKDTSLDISKIKSKYILIDFWFSECLPCIVQFDKYKELYSIYRRNDFEIVGISIDKMNKVYNWRNVINKNNYNWKNYLDINQKVSNRLNINSFPTNYLINERGEIIAKNLSYDELKEKLLDIVKNIIFNDKTIEPD